MDRGTFGTKVCRWIGEVVKVELHNSPIYVPFFSSCEIGMFMSKTNIVAYMDLADLARYKVGFILMNIAIYFQNPCSIMVLMPYPIIQLKFHKTKRNILRNSILPFFTV